MELNLQITNLYMYILHANTSCSYFYFESIFILVPSYFPTQTVAYNQYLQVKMLTACSNVIEYQFEHGVTIMITCKYAVSWWISIGNVGSVTIFWLYRYLMSVNFLVCRVFWQTMWALVGIGPLSWLYHHVTIQRLSISGVLVVS